MYSAKKLVVVFPCLGEVAIGSVVDAKRQNNLWEKRNGVSPTSTWIPNEFIG
jgi:hypothetical protein